MRVRSQNMLTTTEQLGKISALINEDMSQVGAKAWMGISSSSNVVNVEGLVYTAEANFVLKEDYSSYMLWHREYANNNVASGDSIVFRAIAIDGNGIYKGVKEVSLALRDNGELHRKCRTVTAAVSGVPAADGCTIATSLDENDVISVLMGSGISNFRLTPSVPGVGGSSASQGGEQLFPTSSDSKKFILLTRTATGGGAEKLYAATPSCSEPYESCNIIGFQHNAGSQAKHHELYLAEPGKTWPECHRFNLKMGETYAVEFRMPIASKSSGGLDTASTQFVPGSDHIAVGFRKYGTGAVLEEIPVDAFLYPFGNIEQSNFKQRAEFSPAKDVSNVCVALTFSFYSPKAVAGTFNIRDFKVLLTDDKAFHFAKPELGYDPNYGTEDFNPEAERIRQKNSVKAFEMILEVKRKEEKVRTASSIDNGMIILTPNNGIGGI